MSGEIENLAPKLPIVFARGTPMSPKLLAELLDFLRENNERKVFCPKQPRSLRPAESRPKILEMTIAKNNLEQFHLVGHSYGCPDVLRAVAEMSGEVREKIASVILVNSPGAAKNGVLRHSFRFLKYLFAGKSAVENKMLFRFFRAALARNLGLIPEIFDIVALDLDELFAAVDLDGIPHEWLQSPDDTFLYPKKIESLRQPDRYLKKGGNHCGILFDPEEYGGKVVLDFISEIENPPREK